LQPPFLFGEIGGFMKKSEENYSEGGSFETTIGNTQYHHSQLFML